MSRQYAVRSADERNLAHAMLARLKRGTDLRKGKVRRVKRSVVEQTYLNALKLQVAVERLCEELGS